MNVISIYEGFHDALTLIGILHGAHGTNRKFNCMDTAQGWTLHTIYESNSYLSKYGHILKIWTFGLPQIHGWIRQSLPQYVIFMGHV